VKRCFKCGAEKPRTEFYPHRAMADGLLGKCKDCTKLDARIDRQTNPRVREYDRERANQPHRKVLAARITKEWRAKHPGRQRAHNMAARAEIQAPEYCEGCGLKRRVEKHHPDYSRPLLVVWLCKPCHAIADKIRRRLEAS
jgi:hypothetical protein